MEGPQDDVDRSTSRDSLMEPDASAPGRTDALPGEGFPLPPPPGREDITTSTTPVSKRIGGIDMARALAIIGMVMVHFASADVNVDDPAGFVYETSHGRASILFIVLAGVGVSLLAGSRSPARLAGTTRRLLFRAAILFPLGLGLQALDTRVAIILQYYAVYFLIALAFLRLRDRSLLAISAVTLLAAPVIYIALWFAQPDWYGLAGERDISEPAALFRALVLTGYYPALVWTAPLVFGMWLGRRDLRATANRWRLLAGGVATAAVAYPVSWLLTTAVGAPPQDAPSWRWLAVAEPHSEMPLWLLGSMAVAAAILGACLILADRLPRLTWPLVAAGQLALSIYVGHLLVLAWFPEWLVRGVVESAAVSVARFAVVAIALATAWRAVAPRGPLEWLLHLPFQRRAAAS